MSRSTPTQAGRPLSAARLRGVAARVEEEFRAFVLARDFSCLGARAALRHPSFRFGVYLEMGSDSATESLGRDLADFASGAAEEEFATFVAVFLASAPEAEIDFEEQLWSQLQRLHDADGAAAWDPSVSSDPEAPDFSFSFGGTAFFVVGLHPESSRLARRFGWPALVFNPHAQFEQLRADGRYEGLREAIRARELALQGSVNPNLSDFSERSEASQYSGRPTEPGWRCPFTGRGG
jgi:FPC/CPF motif-containing protein YcgG